MPLKGTETNPGGAIGKVLAEPTPYEDKGYCGSADYQEVSAEEIYAVAGIPAPEAAEPGGRWINLDEFLDGTYTPPSPNLGAQRE